MNTDHTLEEVGRQFDVTRERIRQIEAKALRKLRHPSRAHKLSSFLEESSSSPTGVSIDKGSLAIFKILIILCSGNSISTANSSGAVTLLKMAMHLHQWISPPKKA
jgi:hypothetical protein